MRGVLALVILFSFRDAVALEIWLAQTPDCNSCEIFQTVAERHRYGDTLRYHDGKIDLVIPIRDVGKGKLTDDILRQLAPHSGANDPYWRITLTVLVVDNSRVLASGNIADSADNRLLAHSHAMMFPPAEPRPDDPAVVGEDLHREFFLTHWNLEYFVKVALGRRAARQPTPLVDLESEKPWDSGTANMILWDSAGAPRDNALFISQRMGEIRSELDSLDLDDVRFVTLYGHGPHVPGNDTSDVVDGRTLFKRANLPADLSSSGESLNRVLTGIRRKPARLSQSPFF